MRLQSAMACLVLFAVACGFWAAGSDIQSQGAAGSESRDEQFEPPSSLEVGDPFDDPAQLEFERQLKPEERDSLIMLKSRYAVADPACPLPKTSGEVFYVKFHRPLDRELAGRLKGAGASFVGYAYPHTHFIRVGDAGDTPDVARILKDAPEVAGTLLRKPVDACSEDAWEILNRGDWNSREFRLLFWRDVTPGAKDRVLREVGAEITYAHRESDGSISDRVIYIDVILTPAMLQALAAHTDIEWIEPHYELVTHNVASAALANASPATIGPSTAYDLTGKGQVSVVFDAGTARYSHTDYLGGTGVNPFEQYFSGIGTRRVLTAPEIAAGQPGWGLPDNSGVHYHAAHVTGTVVGNGASDSVAQGLAPEGHVVSMGWGSMDYERQVLRHYFRHVADNHSYGQGGGGTGGYNSSAQASDIDIRDIWLNETKSAGNDGSNSNTVGDDTCRKNSYVIAATQDNGDIASFSSRGPSDDGRLIPHFAANGVNLYSTWSTGDSDYDSISGTSMSAPSVNGALLLLSELWKREMNGHQPPPDVLRGILAATAQDRYNQGPDYRYGFGIIDVQRAADLILDNRASGGDHVIRGTIRQGDSYDYDIEVTSSAQPLKVVCSWLDIYASTSASITLVNDIDIELIEPNGVTVHYPWSGLSSGSLGNQTYPFTRTGPNNRDNIELVEVDSPATGTWTVRVTGTSIPSIPQATVLNDATGFVLVSENAMSAPQFTVEDRLNTLGPVSIPDGSQTGLTREFKVDYTHDVRNVRVYVDVRHLARGDIEIELEHPDGTTAVIETPDSSTRPDIIGVFPDTRQYDDDTFIMNGRPADGTWKVHVRDVTLGNVGTLEYLALGIDFDIANPAANHPPTAEAGSDSLVNEGDLVVLNASGSSDPENDTLAYQWVQVTGTPLNLTNTTSDVLTFTAPQVPITQDLVFWLEVDDGNFNRDGDYVTVAVNKLPIADAGPDFSVREGSTGQLNGNQSFDPDGGPVTFQWAEQGTSLVTLSGADTSAPTFVAPQVSQVTVVTFVLTVDDGIGSASDTVNVTILDDNAPVANAGADFYAAYGSGVQLDGSLSDDPDGDPLTYVWTQIGGTTVTLSGADTATPTFTAPVADDLLVFELQVDDGNGNTDADTVTVTVNESGAQPSAGGDDASGGGGSDDGGGCSTGDQPAWMYALLLLALGGILVARSAPNLFCAARHRLSS